MAQFDKDKPAGNQKIRLSDDDIRTNNYALEDAIGRDHKFPTGDGVDSGEHTKVTFNAQVADPAAVANKMFLYTKDIASKVELHVIDEDGNVVAITRGGVLYVFPTNNTYVQGLNAAGAAMADIIKLNASDKPELAADATLNGDVTVGTSVTIPNSGLHILDTNASHDLIIKPGSNLTADRILTITTGDAARTLTLSGNPTLNDWFNQGVKSTSSPTHRDLTLSAPVNIYALDHDSFAGFVANEHINHDSITLTAGTGLSGGGTIAANRTFNLSHLGIQNLVDPNADRIAFWDDSAGAFKWLVPSTGLAISATNLTTNDSQIVHDNLSGFVANEHINHTSVSISAGTGLTGGGTIAANRTLSIGTGGVQYSHLSTSATESINVSQRVAKAWVNYTRPGGTPTIIDDFNVSSLTDMGTGQTRINFTEAMPNNDYAAVATQNGGASAFAFTDAFLTTSVKVWTRSDDGSLQDELGACLVVFAG